MSHTSNAPGRTPRHQDTKTPRGHALRVCVSACWPGTKDEGRRTKAAPFVLRRPSFVRDRAAEGASRIGIAYYLLLLLIVPLLVACGGGRPGYVAQQQRAGDLTIALERPQQAQILKDYELFVTLIDAGGKPVDGATVFIDMVMQGMPIGTNQPLA